MDSQREVFLHVPRELNKEFSAGVLFTLSDQLILSTVVGTGCNLDDLWVVASTDTPATPDYDIKVEYGGIFSVVGTPTPATPDSPHPNETFWANQVIDGFGRYLDGNLALKKSLLGKKVAAVCESIPGKVLASLIVS